MLQQPDLALANSEDALRYALIAACTAFDQGSPNLPMRRIWPWSIKLKPCACEAQTVRSRPSERGRGTGLGASQAGTCAGGYGRDVGREGARRAPHCTRRLEAIQPMGAGVHPGVLRVMEEVDMDERGSNTGAAVVLMDSF